MTEVARSHAELIRLGAIQYLLAICQAQLYLIMLTVEQITN